MLLCQQLVIPGKILIISLGYVQEDWPLGTGGKLLGSTFE